MRKTKTESAVTALSWRRLEDNNAEMRTREDVDRFLRAILLDFISLVDVLESGLLDELIEIQIITDCDEESVQGNHLPTREEKARHVWSILSSLPHSVFINKAFPVLCKKCAFIPRAYLRSASCKTLRSEMDPPENQNGEGSDSEEMCLRCAMTKRLRLTSMADILCSNNLLTMDKYRKIITDHRLKEGNWNYIFDSLKNMSPSNKCLLKDMENLLATYLHYVPKDLFEQMTRGFPCTCNQRLASTKPNLSPRDQDNNPYAYIRRPSSYSGVTDTSSSVYPMSEDEYSTAGDLSDIESVVSDNDDHFDVQTADNHGFLSPENKSKNYCKQYQYRERHTWHGQSHCRGRRAFVSDLIEDTELSQVCANDRSDTVVNEFIIRFGPPDSNDTDSAAKLLAGIPEENIAMVTNAECMDINLSDEMFSEDTSAITYSPHTNCEETLASGLHLGDNSKGEDSLMAGTISSDNPTFIKPSKDLEDLVIYVKGNVKSSVVLTTWLSKKVKCTDRAARKELCYFIDMCSRLESISQANFQKLDTMLKSEEMRGHASHVLSQSSLMCSKLHDSYTELLTLQKAFIVCRLYLIATESHDKEEMRDKFLIMSRDALTFVQDLIPRIREELQTLTTSCHQLLSSDFKEIAQRLENGLAIFGVSD